MTNKAVIFFGRSGSGKGTQAKLLSEYLKKLDVTVPVLYVETGAKFRELATQDNHSSRIIKEIMGEGGLMPEFLPIWIWSDFLVKNFTGKEHLIFDGLCRRLHEASILDSAFKFYGLKNVYIVLIDVSRAWAKERLLSRGRKDDNNKDIDARLDWFDSDVMKSVEFFKQNSNYKFISVNGEQSIEKVHQDIVKNF